MTPEKKDSADDAKAAEARVAEFLVEDERSKVETWRLYVLTLAGYPLAIAERLAMSLEADLHVACELLKGGCSPETAAEILL
jgi:hypothetical protein